MSVRLAYWSPPGVFSAFARGLVDRRPRRLPDEAHVPHIEARCEAATTDVLAVARYRAVCGITDDGLLPIAYPHVMAGTLHFEMLLHPAFPVRLPGLVHLANSIEVLEAIPESSTLAFECRLDESEVTHRGAEFSLRTEAFLEGRPAWRETMTFVSPAPRRDARRAREPEPELPEPAGAFEVPADTGRRYARVSGDYNPIHLAAPLAKRFGFRSAIAHGMWSLARGQGWLGGGATAGSRLDVRFLRPLFLPGHVTLLAGPDPSGGTGFWLLSTDSGHPVLRGSWRPGGSHDGSGGRPPESPVS